MSFPQTPPELNASNAARYYVVVTGSYTEPEDRDVAGTYLIFVDPNLAPQQAASAALDAFHMSVPVELLDDFDFEVRDSSGCIVAEPDDRIAYTLCDKARCMGQIDEIPSSDNEPGF